MKKEEVLQALQKMRDSSKSRKFVQAVDLAVNFSGIDFKKEANRIDLDVALPFTSSKTESKKALVFVRSPELASELKEKVQKIVMENEIENLSKNKKEVNEIISSFDVLLAEGPVMLTVAKFLGQMLAPKNKMPKPFSSVKDVENVLSKAGGTVKVSNKKGKFMPVVHVKIGTEKMKNEELAENILAVYNALLEKLEKHKIKSVFVKLTMGPAIKIEEKKEVKEKKDEKNENKKNKKKVKK